MRNYNRITPEGTKDLLLEECLVRRETEEKIRSVFQSQGYDELVTPGLEFFDVFQSEAVQYPQEQLYKLTDSKGRLIVLRPNPLLRLQELLQPVCGKPCCHSGCAICRRLTALNQH